MKITRVVRAPPKRDSWVVSRHQVIPWSWPRKFFGTCHRWGLQVAGVLDLIFESKKPKRMTRIIVKQYLTSKTELMNQKVKRYNYSRNYELIWIDWWFIIPTIWWFIIATTHYVMWEKCPVCHKFTTQALEVVRKHSPAIYFYDVM